MSSFLGHRHFALCAMDGPSTLNTLPDCMCVDGGLLWNFSRTLTLMTIESLDMISMEPQVGIMHIISP